MSDRSPVGLTREEAEAVCELVGRASIGTTAQEVYESEAFDSAMTKLDALASGGSPPSGDAVEKLLAAMKRECVEFTPLDKGLAPDWHFIGRGEDFDRRAIEAILPHLQSPSLPAEPSEAEALLHAIDIQFGTAWLEHEHPDLIAKLRAPASADPSPSPPVKPSPEAIEAAHRVLRVDDARTVVAALRAAYRVDGR